MNSRPNQVQPEDAQVRQHEDVGDHAAVPQRLWNERSVHEFFQTGDAMN